MKRLTHHQYTTIGMLEDAVADAAADAPDPLHWGLWVNTRDLESGALVMLLHEDAVFAGPGMDLFDEQIAALTIDEFGDVRMLDEPHTTARAVAGYRLAELIRTHIKEN